MIRDAELREAHQFLVKVLSAWQPTGQDQRCLHSIATTTALLIQVCDRLASRLDALEKDLAALEKRTRL